MKERHATRNRAFTMIELLVVMAILVFLAGLSFWGIREIREGLKIKQTQVVVKSVASAIKSFHTQYLEWPTQTMLDGLTPPQKWHEFLNGGYAKVMNGGLAKYENRGKFLELASSALNAGDDIIDAWNNPISVNVDALKGAVLVYSFGPDCTAATADDIKNSH